MREWLRRTREEYVAAKAWQPIAVRRQALSRHALREIAIWLDARLPVAGERMLAVYRRCLTQAVAEGLPTDDADADQLDEIDAREDAEAPLTAPMAEYHIFARQMQEFGDALIGVEYVKTLSDLAAAVSSLDADARLIRPTATGLRAGIAKHLQEEVDRWRLSVLLDALAYGRTAVSILAPNASELFRQQTVGLLTQLMADVTMADIHAGRPHPFSDNAPAPHAMDE